MVTTSYKSPGVYREDIFPKQVPELQTGVPVFLGLVSRFTPPAQSQNTTDASDALVKLTLWTQFQDYLGAPLPNSYLAVAVKGFFENGGRVCYVLPLRDSRQQLIQEVTSIDQQSVVDGLEHLESLTTIDIICAPDLAGQSRLQQLILEHCDRMGDRFTILDAPETTTPAQLPDLLRYRQSLRGHNGALYTPWVTTQQGDIPPSGHIAGVYARSDREVGVHQAPANLLLADVLDLGINLSNAEQAQLNPDDEIAGINCLRILPGRGIRIWGAYTLSQDAQRRYLNVQRLVLTVGRWIALNLADVAFEPNDIRLWVRIERELTAYFEGLAQQGALQGRVPAEAFYVKCDAETNPVEVRDRGQVITEIGLAPTVPSEFIVVRLIHGDTGVTLT